MTEYTGPERRNTDALVAAVKENNSRVAEMNARVGEMNENLELLVLSVQARPTETQVKRLRRILVLFFISAVVFAIQLHDVHVNQCMMRASTNEVNQQILIPPPEPSPVCGILFPLHSEAHTEAWPSTANAVGLFGYVVLFGLLGWWSFRRPERSAPQVIQDILNDIENPAQAKERHRGVWRNRLDD